MDSRLLAFIREKLGIQPRESQLYEMALTGWSITGSPEQSQVDKEEFLGDAVLGLAISELLMLYHPNENVGVLSASKAALVSGKVLARKAAALGLPELLKSRGVPLPARMQDVLADVMESLIGAIYLDLGYPAVRSFIERLYRDDFPSVILGWEQRDLKGVLQEILVREIGEMPEYRTRPGNGHSFVSEVFVRGCLVGRGVGGTKKEAEIYAAEKALQSLNQWLRPFIERKPAASVSAGPRTSVSLPGVTESPTPPIPGAAEASSAALEAPPEGRQELPEASPAEQKALPPEGALDVQGSESPAVSPEEVPSAPSEALLEAPAPARRVSARRRRTRRAGRRIQAHRRRKRAPGTRSGTPEPLSEPPPSDS